MTCPLLKSYFGFEFIFLHGIMTDLKYDVRMLIDIEEGEIGQSVLLGWVIHLTQCSKNSEPM